MRTWLDEIGIVERGDAEHAEARPRRIIPDPLAQLCYRVIGAAIEVHRELGPGFLEHVYELALTNELTARLIPFERQVVLPIAYKGCVIAEHRADLVIDHQVVVELKAVRALEAVHLAQAVSYVKAGGFQLGLVINFNVPILRNGVRRVLGDLPFEPS